jgi:hypothetical protein
MKFGKVTLFLESWGPLLAGGLSFAALLYWRDEIVSQFANHGWKAEGLYGAVFNWAAIQTGFAFGVYGFVAGKTGGFIEAVRGTVAMARFQGYVKAANVLGFVLTVLSIPLLVTNPDLTAPTSAAYAVVSGWFALFVWAFVTFLRIAYTFGHISGVKDNAPFYPAGS